MCLPIGDLMAWHMLAVCLNCRDERYIPNQTMVARYGAQQTLAMIVPRLRFRFPSCRCPAAFVRVRSGFLEDRGREVIEAVLERPRCLLGHYAARFARP